MRQQTAPAFQEAQTYNARLNWQVLEDLVITRLLFGAPEGETEVQLRKDLHPLVMQKMSAVEWRTNLGQIIVALVDQEFIRPVRANAYMTTENCPERAANFLQTSRLPKAPWHEIRDGHLIALALGLTPTSHLVSRLVSAEGLRSAVLTGHFNLPYDIATVTVEQLRFGLAKTAQDQGLTSGIRTTLIEKSDLSQKEAVMMGAKLLKSGHVVESDGELMACLAQEIVGAVNESAAELRQMLFRQLISSKESSEVMANVHNGEQAGALTGAALGTRQGNSEPIPPLPEFTHLVLKIAQDIAIGWPGNKRAFISHIWRDLSASFPFWGINEDEYKEMILNAHRAGLLRLAIADLRDKTNVEDVAQSCITYKNSEWHFVRVDDLKNE